MEDKYLPRIKGGAWGGWMDRKEYVYMWTNRYFAYAPDNQQFKCYASAACYEKECKGSMLVSHVVDVPERGKGKRKNRFNVHGHSAKGQSSPGASTTNNKVIIFEVSAMTQQVCAALSSENYFPFYIGLPVLSSVFLLIRDHSLRASM